MVLTVPMGTHLTLTHTEEWGKILSGENKKKPKIIICAQQRPCKMWVPIWCSLIIYADMQEFLTAFEVSSVFLFFTWAQPTHCTEPWSRYVVNIYDILHYNFTQLIYLRFIAHTHIQELFMYGYSFGTLMVVKRQKVTANEIMES